MSSVNPLFGLSSGGASSSGEVVYGKDGKLTQAQVMDVFAGLT
jgi:hypothetical protein